MSEHGPMSLANRYKEQLLRTGEDLRERAVNFKELSASAINDLKSQLESKREQLQPKVQAIAESVKDVESSVPSNASQFLLETYLWASVCLFGFGAASFIGGTFLSGMFGAIFNNGPLLALTYVVVPAFVYYTLRKVQMSDEQREQVVLFGAVAEGALIGTVFGNRYATIMEPPLFLMSLSAGLCAYMAGTKEQVAGNHRAFLSAVLGGVAAAYVVFGFIFNFSFNYVLATAIIGAAAFVDLQLKLASIQRGDSSVQLEQWQTVVIMTIGYTISHLLSSSTKEGADAAAAANKK